MKNKKLVPKFACSVGLAVSFGLPATTVSAGGFALEEVVVSARKRGAESIQDIGGSLQAIGGNALEEKGALGFADYMRQVPSLSANNAGSGQAQISMRGVNASRLNHANPNIPSTVGVYLGETPISTSGFNPDSGLFDINRVEVLRGPQGTLFGASSMSGVLRVIPNDASTDEFSASGGFTGFSTKDGASSSSTNAMVNIPVSDDFAVRILGYNIANGGYIDNVYSGEDDYNDETIFGGRISTYWNINDNIENKVMLVYQSSSAGGRAKEAVSGDPRELVLQGGYDLPLSDESLDQFRITDELQNAKIVDDSFDDEFFLASVQFDAEVGDFSFTSVSSYFDRTMENILDDNRRTRYFYSDANFWGDAGVGRPLLGDYDPVTLAGAIEVGTERMENITDNKKFTQEFRVTSLFDGPLNFIAGIYYEDDSRHMYQTSLAPGLEDWLNSEHQLDGWWGLTTNGAKEKDAHFVGPFEVDIKQTAVFAEASYTVGDFEITAGGRYYEYDADSYIRWQGWVEFGDDILDDSASESGFNPMAEVVYTPNEDLLFYAKAAKGFRLGGVQQFISESWCGAELDSLGVGDIPKTIDGDSLWNYEGGVKSTILGGAATLNASAYYIDWKGARTQTFLNCGWIIEYDVVDIESQGLELEITSQVSENLMVNFGMGYNDSSVNGDAEMANGTLLAEDGDRAPFAPEWSTNIGFDYQRQIKLNDMTWFLRGDVSYVSDQTSELGSQQLAPVDIPSNTQVNLFTGFKKDGWSVSLFARNLTNERIVTGVDTDRQQPVQYSIARPRNIGMTISFDM